MKTLAILALTLLVVQPCVIHPTIHASNNSERTAEFLDGILFTCPEGTKLHWPKDVPMKNLSYSAIHNAEAASECK